MFPGIRWSCLGGVLVLQPTRPSAAQTASAAPNLDAVVALGCCRVCICRWRGELRADLEAALENLSFHT